MFKVQKWLLIIFFLNLNPKLTRACSHSRPKDPVIKLGMNETRLQSH